MDDTAVRRMKELLGKDTKGEFRIERQIGKGGMAVVYLATEIRLERKVAIKVLPPALTFGNGVERFTREARTAASLDHPNIIPIYRVSSGTEIFWYAMKYLEGRSLDQYLRERPRCSVEEAIAILGHVAEALDFAHEHGVVHRDVKPANIMLDSRSQVVVTDFGIAKALSEVSLTHSGAIVGTPYYMSPEQGAGNVLSGASDQYSVGVMAYRMLAGQLPFDGDTSINVIVKHCTLDPPPLDVLRPGLPRHVYEAVHRTLAKRPEDRWRSVTAFVNALREPTEVYGTTEPSTLRLIPTVEPPADARPGKPPDSGKKRRRPVVYVLTFFLVAVLSASGWLVVSERGEEVRVAVTAWLQSIAERLATNRVEQDSLARAGTQAGPSDSTSGTTATGSQESDSAGQERQVPAERVTPSPPRLGAIAVVGLPPDGQLNVDGVRQEATTVRAQPGRHIIDMIASGYETVTETVTVLPGERVRLRWAADPTPPPQPDVCATEPPPREYFLTEVCYDTRPEPMRAPMFTVVENLPVQSVLVYVKVTANGEVETFSFPNEEQIPVEAIRLTIKSVRDSMRFEPATKDGSPIDAWTELQVLFRSP